MSLAGWLALNAAIMTCLRCDDARLSLKNNNGLVGGTMSLEVNGVFKGTLGTAIQIDVDISITFPPTSGTSKCPPNVAPKTDLPLDPALSNVTSTSTSAPSTPPRPSTPDPPISDPPTPTW